MIVPTGPDGGVDRALGQAVALYVHVPFCQARCAYCDFNTYAGLESLIPAYGKGLRREIEAVAERWGPLHISTVYVGGGTPPLLPLDVLGGLIDGVRSSFDLPQSAEITVEVNPGTVDEPYLSGLRSIGIDRLSIGAQSASDEELEILGRIHSWSDVVRAVDQACTSGFENLNLDLLFGLPGQSLERWEETLEAALELDPEHLSLYGLTVEEGTPLEQRIASEELAAPVEDRVADMYELAEEMLAKATFFHYEISNWARKHPDSRLGDSVWWPEGAGVEPAPERIEGISGYVCRHNLTYWRNEAWLGIGAGAHSWIPGSTFDQAVDSVPGSPAGKRRSNVNHPEAYVAVASEESDLASLEREVEAIGRGLEMGETMMLGLRLAEGVRAARFSDRFGVKLGAVFGAELADLSALGLLTWDGLVARLTARGRLLGNRVFERFI